MEASHDVPSTNDNHHQSSYVLPCLCYQDSQKSVTIQKICSLSSLHVFHNAAYDPIIMKKSSECSNPVHHLYSNSLIDGFIHSMIEAPR